MIATQTWNVSHRLTTFFDDLRHLLSALLAPPSSREPNGLYEADDQTVRILLQPIANPEKEGILGKGSVVCDHILEEENLSD